MKSFVTSYNNLLARPVPGSPAVERIEIPLIQRDYAQGRVGTKVEHIRSSFLSSLRSALTGGDPVGLDFVFGDVENGTFRPVDGQQRLTTLFLLHWYLAFRACRLEQEQEQAWKRFTYATRPSSRLFCERLVICQPDVGDNAISPWIRDQSWYLYPWNHDPTIQAMLVMIDAIHHAFRHDDCIAAWARLTDRQDPAITFHVLPIEQMGLTDDLYIKMNSRGKPLTMFENFKARFERTLEGVVQASRAHEFARKVDGAWSDLLWRYRGDSLLIDDEFLRYFRFVSEVSEWRQTRFAIEDITAFAERVYGPGNTSAPDQVDFLFRAFDTWAAVDGVDVDVAAAFSDLFVAASHAGDIGTAGKIVLFGQDGSALDVNLFAACCRHYEDMRGNRRVFSLAHTILLYAVILNRVHGTHDFMRRLRVLRNLLEASGNELRLDNMPAIVTDVERLIVDGAYESILSLNQGQVANEKAKAEILKRNPDLESRLHQLEDHPILRGCLTAFDLNTASFERRAVAFLDVFPNQEDGLSLLSLTGAMLATSDYAIKRYKYFHFGSATSHASWRELLTGATPQHPSAVSEALGRLLDVVAISQGSVADGLAEIQKLWLVKCEEEKTLTWRYYFVKYPCMRRGRSGIYVSLEGDLGYSVCMLDKRLMHSWYQDPYLLAILEKSGVGSAVDKLRFTGDELQPRWLRLSASRVGLRCVAAGIEILGPPESTSDTFIRVCNEHNIQQTEDRWLLPVTQLEHEGHLVDAEDRVDLAAKFLCDLVEAGL